LYLWALICLQSSGEPQTAAAETELDVMAGREREPADIEVQ
jgi:hypothetical protein